MSRDDLRTLFDYHYWACERVLAAADRVSPEEFTREIGGSFASVRDTLAHIYLADAAWLARWRGQSPTAFPPLDGIRDVSTLREGWAALAQDVRALLDELGDEGVHRHFDYRLMSGAAGRSTFAEAMQHVVNHATYHRGQVTTLLRIMGLPPPASLDLITFYRERGG